ncbi:MAG: tRNA uridine-5-carboxymethylaminomethyl(34) synthesis GTPase MnmE [Elusimicrobia bacterium]|jgi:tRNA modification GTPase|nr:tRNA uridine-5-carboxymethylaminomethyl(34) synthesis GTPase MnmE [Elusimicrobiota bacterium]
MTTSLNDTIVALSTPFGVSALAVIRLSGPEALSITNRIFSPSRVKNIKSVKSYTVHHGRIKDGNKEVDEVMVAVYKAPHTYTAQDIVEVTCHGGGVIISTLLELFSQNGARPAEPGEFTKRAFLNGKMDLSQAESVNSLINAGSRRALNGALKILNGSLREKTEKIKSALFEVKANIDADIEWGDTEELEIIDRSDIIDLLDAARGSVEYILDNSKAYAGIYSGFRVVIIGRPNAGKSSLFNRLLCESRSIVNNIPGTTRDVIESEVISDRYLIRYVDTAGLGLENPSETDILSARKSVEEIEAADFVIILIDKEKGVGKPEKDILKIASGKKRVIVINKSDKAEGVAKKDLSAVSGESKIIETSCKADTGLEKLKEEIKHQIDKAGPEHIMVSVRQKNSFNETARGIKRVIDIMETSPVSYEVASYELSEAINYIGLIDGTVIKEDILDRIFSDFCIGK